MSRPVFNYRNISGVIWKSEGLDTWFIKNKHPAAPTVYYAAKGKPPSRWLSSIKKADQ